MKKTIQSILYLLAVVLSYNGSACYASVVFQENFEAYTVGTDIAGQGGWFHPEAGAQTDPFLITSGNGLSSNVANGHTLPSGASFMSRVNRTFPTLDFDAESIFSFDAYAFSSGPPSSNSEIGLSNSDLTSRVFWNNQLLTSGGIGDWKFYAFGNRQTITGFGYDEVINGEIIIDGVNNKVYGRITHSGGVAETARVGVTDSQISQLFEVTMLFDYRDGPQGAEYDNIVDLH